MGRWGRHRQKSWESVLLPNYTGWFLCSEPSMNSPAGLSKQQRYTAAAAKSLQSSPTLCDLIDGSPPCSAIPGILQARTLEWVAIAFSIVWKWKVKVKSLSRIRLVATPWTAAYQAPPSMRFSRQEYWSGLPLPSPGETGGNRIMRGTVQQPSEKKEKIFPFA